MTIHFDARPFAANLASQEADNALVERQPYEFLQALTDWAAHDPQSQESYLLSLDKRKELFSHEINSMEVTFDVQADDKVTYRTSQYNPIPYAAESAPEQLSRAGATLGTLEYLAMHSGNAAMQADVTSAVLQRPDLTLASKKHYAGMLLSDNVTAWHGGNRLVVEKPMQGSQALRVVDTLSDTERTAWIKDLAKSDKSNAANALANLALARRTVSEADEKGAQWSQPAYIHEVLSAAMHMKPDHQKVFFNELSSLGAAEDGFRDLDLDMLNPAQKQFMLAGLAGEGRSGGAALAVLLNASASGRRHGDQIANALVNSKYEYADFGREAFLTFAEQPTKPAVPGLQQTMVQVARALDDKHQLRVANDWMTRHAPTLQAALKEVGVSAAAKD